MNGVVGAIMFLPYYKNGVVISPTNWFQCNGQYLGISSYVELFSVLGTQYGGDGVTNFRIPKIDSIKDVFTGTDIHAWICYQGAYPTFVTST